MHYVFNLWKEENMGDKDLLQPLRIGTLGASRIAPAALINPARKNEQIEVVAVAARERAKAEKYAQKHGIAQVYDTYEALIADPTLDAIYNPLPNNLHAEWTIRALQAGKHVLCEKPLASNADEARAMAETADAENRYLMEAFHWRYHRMAKRLIEIVRSGEIGAIKHVGASLCVPFALPGDIRYRLDLAGGAMMDLGAYTVSMLRHTTGEEPEVVSAKAALSSPGVDRLMEAEVKFPSGATGMLQASLFSHKLLAMWLRVEGEKGTIYARNPTVPQMGISRLKIKTDAGTRVEKYRYPATYEEQLVAFVGLVREGTAVPTDGWDGVRNMEVIDAVYQAAGMEVRGKVQ
jgi:predicted dehydrogenase